MNGDSRPKAAAADSRSEVGSQSSPTGGQGAATRQYDPERYPPVSVEALQRLPGSSARSFAIGVALGRWLDADGRSERLKSGKSAAAALIKSDRLPAVLTAIGITARTWREYVTEWESNYIAHRCGRGTVCLFTRPFLDACPNCKAWIPIDHTEKPAHLPRGPGFGNGAINATPTALMAPLRGTNSAVRAMPDGTNSAVPEHAPATPDTRGLYGKEVGRSGTHPSDEAVDLEEVRSQEALSESRSAHLVERDDQVVGDDVTSVDTVLWPQHFEDKSCPECTCWPHQGGHFAGCSRREAASA